MSLLKKAVTRNQMKPIAVKRKKENRSPLRAVKTLVCVSFD